VPGTSSRKTFVHAGEAVGILGSDNERLRREGDALVVLPDERWGNPVFGDACLDEGDFHIHARLTLDHLAGTGVSLLLGGHYHYNWSRSQGNYTFRICFDQDITPSRKEKIKDTFIVYGGANPRRYWHADESMSEKQVFGPSRDHIRPGEPFTVDLHRQGNQLTLEIDGQTVFRIPFEEETSPLTGRNGSHGYSMSVRLGEIITPGRSGDTGWPLSVGFLPDQGALKIHDFYAEGRFCAPVFPTSDAWLINTGGYGIYRIPAVCRTPGGRLLAFAEARRSYLSRGWEFHVNTGREMLSAELHCAMKSSDDGGRTWSQQTIIPQLSRGKTYEARDPSPLPDFDTGEIFLFTRGPYVVSSKDEGRTWSEPRSLAGEPTGGWSNLTAGTGNSAIQLRRGPFKGRLIAALYGSNVVTLTVSDDHGNTWQPGASHIGDQNGEPSILELSDGCLMVSPRHRDDHLGRLFMISEDGGATFCEKRYEPTLAMAGQGEIVAAEPLQTASGTVRPIVCCGPAENKTRLTIAVSLDDGETWPISRVIDDGSAANLALVALPDGHVGALYERDKYRRLSFQRVDLRAIIEPTGNS
jgi:hypothetical protein